MPKSKKSTKTIPIERLHELLICDAENGKLYWRVDKGRAKAGSEAGYRQSRGYVVAGVDGVLLYRHRAIFAMVHNRWPDDQIDHINGVRGDDRIDNLREATDVENNRNQGAYKNNRSGYKGVYWNRRRSKWCAQIKVNRKSKFLGLFDCKHEAAAAYAAAAAKYHGEFARVA